MEGLAKRLKRSGGRKGTFLTRSSISFFAFFILLAIFTSAPIWGVQYFINQDGSGHVHAAWLMLELLRSNTSFDELYQFNLLTFPNVLGHWIQAGSLLIISPFESTKLMMTLTYLGLIGSSAFLRWCTHGRDGLILSSLFAASLGYNWLWLQGAYNFILGLIIALSCSGLFYKWRSEMTWKRAAILSTLLVLAFLSHIISFAILGVAIAVLLAFNFSRSSLLKTLAAFAPVLPFILAYLASTEVAGGQMSPYWRSLHDPLSLSQWVTQIRSVDSLVLIRRTALPFIEGESVFYSIFAPIIWIGIAVFALGFGTVRSAASDGKSSNTFLAVSVILVLASFFMPDGLRFSSSTGGLIRERLFIGGLLFVVPVFRISTNSVRAIVSGALLVVVIFNTVALWDYALRSDRDARDFFAATSHIPNDASIVAVTIEPDTFRFAASPSSSMNNYNGILRGVAVWDNYEFGHYLFPLIFRERPDQEFVLRFTQNNAYDLSTPGLMTVERIEALNTLLSDTRIDTLVVWGSEHRIDSIVERHFGLGPLYAEGGVRLYHRRK